MKPAFRSIVTSVIAAAAALGQTNLGSIQGTVVGSDGTPLAGARVFAAIKAPTQKTKAPPTLASYVANGVVAAPANALTAGPAKAFTAASANAFTITKLPPGTYILCAQTAVAGWLDPCHWSPNVPVINLAAGQNLTGQTVVMTKGAVVQIRINDPSKLLPAKSTPIPKDVEVLALGSNNAYYNAQIASTDAGGQSRQVTLPFNATHTLIVRSHQFKLADSTGAAVSAAGHTQTLQVSAAAAAPLFTYTVVGRAQ